MRCGHSDIVKHAPPTGYPINEVITSVESADARVGVYVQALETLLALQGIDHPAMMLMEESGMYTDVIILHEKVKALANKAMVALKRVKADGKLGPTIWVDDPQRVRER